MLSLSAQVERVSCARHFQVAHILTTFAAVVALCASPSAFGAGVCADQSSATEPAEATCDFQKELWINPGFFSLHFSKIEERNPVNLGFGAEWRFTEDAAIVAGTYNNSVRKQSTYGGVSWEPIPIGPTQLGAVVGMIRGYPKLNHGGWVPMIMPTLTYAYGRFGFNLVLVPPVGDKNIGSLSLQLKLRIW